LSRKWLLIAIIIALALVALAWGIGGEIRKLARQSPIESAGFVGAEACRDCHEDRHASWYRTWHRTMTQQASEKSVLGAFDGQTLNAFGGLVQPLKRANGFAFRYLDPQSGAAQAELPIGRTVGSHRYQQYLTKLDDGSGRWYRLHYLWHVGEQRWVHMNAVFLGDDRQPFDAQVASWNNNCIFCHNAGAEPRATNLDALRARAAAGEQFQARDEMTFDSTVSDLGIGCESCHGPGAEHVARNQSWSRQVALKLVGGEDPTIVNAKRLASERSTQICGACHAGRAPKDAAMLERWMTSGQTYRAGENLNDHVDVLWSHSAAPAHLPDLFANRFWGDGTPRLTAYEYQGMVQSKCFEASDLTCITCHSMHTGDPAGMLTERNRGDAPCLKCHQAFSGDAQAAHTRHPLKSPASRCVNCHMPNAVYGVMQIKRTHRIASPDVTQSAAAGKPDACTNCHGDRSLAWAQDELNKGWGVAPSGPVIRRDGAPADVPDAIASLLAGDPVQQAIAAHQPGWAANTLPLDQLAALMPWLALALEDDRPAVRRFARNSLLALVAREPSRWPGIASALKAFDFTGPVNARGLLVAQIRQQLPALSADQLALAAELRRLGSAQEKQIDIGE
jgi:predicted CXXCH cytochrome family protein